jgi:outer membrane protein OmpA-like peptidoglycan-associated protein
MRRGAGQGRSSSLLLAGCALALASAARADDPFVRGFDPDPARPAITMDGDWVVETPLVRQQRSYHLAFQLDYARGILALYQSDRRLGQLIEGRLQTHLFGSYSFGRFELGADLPIALYQSANMALLSGNGIIGRLADPIPAASVGDLRLLGKLPILDEENIKILSLGAVAELRVPTGNKNAFYGEGPMGVLSGVVGRRVGPLRLDLSLGYMLRQQGQYMQLVVHDAFIYAGGVNWELPWDKIGGLIQPRLIADVNGLVPRGITAESARYRYSGEVRGGLRARVWENLHLDVGIGTGLAASAGYGRESWRLFAGLRWEVVNADRDGDGIPDDQDQCPDVPGLAKYHGCPDGDTDGDGIMDSVDKCPEIPGLKEFDGCPDSDGDGVPDYLDKCPNDPGPKELDGCPDRDGDGIPDVDDKCPDQKGPASNNGCPPPPEEPLVTVETTRLDLKDQIYFDFGKDTIKPESFKVLDEIARVLVDHAELRQLKIEGHTDNVGAREYNLLLSGKRAASVVRYLEGKNVGKGRLVSEGFGFDKPLATNTTALGRAKNRRVEITILKQDADEPAPPKKPDAKPGDKKPQGKPAEKPTTGSPKPADKPAPASTTASPDGGVSPSPVPVAVPDGGATDGAFKKSKQTPDGGVSPLPLSLPAPARDGGRADAGKKSKKTLDGGSPDAAP